MLQPRKRQITSEEYAGFDGAYDWFNQQLFGGLLPACLITLQRKAKSYGYFANDRFGHRRDQEASTDELALNPDTFQGRSDKEVLSTLVHEMCHCWQEHCGKPSRTGYHNRQWAAKMIEVGLMPSDTGEPDGKQTGQHMTHYIIRTGPLTKRLRSCSRPASGSTGSQQLGECVHLLRGRTRSSTPALHVDRMPGLNQMRRWCAGIVARRWRRGMRRNVKHRRGVIPNSHGG